MGVQGHPLNPPAVPLQYLRGNPSRGLGLGKFAHLGDSPGPIFTQGSFRLKEGFQWWVLRGSGLNFRVKDFSGFRVLEFDVRG